MRESDVYDYRVVEWTNERCAIDFYRDGEKLDPTVTFTDEDAERAGLNQPTRGGKPSNHMKFPRNMKFARAMSNGVGLHCPDLTAGTPEYTPDELGLENPDADSVPEEAPPAGREPGERAAAADGNPGVHPDLTEVALAGGYGGPCLCPHAALRASRTPRLGRQRNMRPLAPQLHGYEQPLRRCCFSRMQEPSQPRSRAVGARCSSVTAVSESTSTRSNPAPRAVMGGASSRILKPGPQSESWGCRVSTGVPTYGWRSCTGPCRPGCGWAMLRRMRPSVPGEGVECVFPGRDLRSEDRVGLGRVARPQGGGSRATVEVGASSAVHASMGRDGIGCFLRTMA